MLFPTDPLRPRKVDPHFEPESVAARQHGHDVALVDVEALVGGDTAGAVRGVSTAGREVVYRGWMLSSDRYAAMAAALAGRKVELRTSAEQYRRAHEFPGWYRVFDQLTPPSQWTVGDDRAEFDRARRALAPGAAVVRDWVKSAKHEWKTATFVPDLDDADAAWRIARRLRAIRDDQFTGGFVLRRFEHFVGAEVRTWWVRGRCVAVTPHPDTPDAEPSDVDAALLDLVIAPAVRTLATPFVTVDLVRDADARWRVVEVGDGQVSDRPQHADAGAFTAAIAG
jgi:hypothetical protein